MWNELAELPRTAGGTAVRAIFDAGVLGSAGGILFLLTVARTGQVTTSAARIAGRLALIGLVAAALSIGFQGGLLTGGPLEVILGPTTWRTGFASLHGNSAVIAFTGLALIAAGVRSLSPAGRLVAVGGALMTLSSYGFAGHVVTAGPRWLTVPALLAHTSAVAFWVGSLLPLRATLSQEDAAPVVRRFSEGSPHSSRLSTAWCSWRSSPWWLACCRWPASTSFA
jgi:copper transport protein